MAIAGDFLIALNVSATVQKMLLGGRYGQTVHATSYGTVVKLQTLAADATTWLDAASNLTADSTTVVILELPPGQYRLLITGASGVYYSLVRIPQ